MLQKPCLDLIRGFGALVWQHCACTADSRDLSDTVFHDWLSLFIREPAAFRQLVDPAGTDLCSLFLQRHMRQKQLRAFCGRKRRVHIVRICAVKIVFLVHFFSPYPLTAPATMPLSIWLLMSRYIRIVGTVATTSPAARPPQFVVYWPTICIMPTVSVRN